jgi:hypothetical protein
MQMGNGFAGIRPIVKDQAKPGFRQADLLSNLSGFEQQMTQHLVVFRCGLGDPWDRFLRDGDDVGRGLRFDVVEGNDQVIS